MKKLLAAFIAVIMLLSLIGCTEKNEIPKNEGNPTSDVSEGENVNTADPVGGAEGEENTDPGDSGKTDELGETDETDGTVEPGEADEPDGTDEPDGSDETDPASRFYFYLFEGGYITYVSAYRQENENGTLLGVLDCKTENAEIVTQNMRYAVVEDGERFLYDIETGEKTYPVWLSEEYDVSFLDTDTYDEPVYIVMHDRDETTSSSALYDTRSESYLTDFDNRHYYLQENSGYIVAEEENENGRISHVYRTDPFEEIASLDGSIFEVTVGEKTLFFAVSSPVWIYDCSAVYNEDLEKIYDGRFYDYSLTSDGNIVVREGDYSEELKTFTVYDPDFNLIRRSREYDAVVGVFGDYECVVDGGKLKIVDPQETNFITLCDWGDNMQFHFMLSGMKGYDYEMGDVDAEWTTGYEANVGTADSPVYEEREMPAFFPAGYYFICEDREIPYGTSGSGIEYYFNPETGEIARFIIKGIGGYAKPVLYLYPEEETEFSVTFDRPELLTVTYPDYNEGWSGTVGRDGTIVGKSGREYYSLYWEESGYVPADFSTGFCVKGSESAEFLEGALDALGFTEREANEFIIYWLPIMQKTEYCLVHFELTEEREAFNGLNIAPKPDSLLRVAIHIRPCDDRVDIEPQYLPSFDRNGFAAVEWGGIVEH